MNFVKKYFWPILVFLGAIAGGGYYAKKSFYPKHQTVKVKKGTMIDSVFGVGTVAANKLFNYKIGTTATLLKAYIDEGANVKKGDPLIEVDDIGVIKAPFDGTVQELDFHEGETIFPQAQILSVANYDDLYLSVAFDERSMVRVKSGLPALITFDSYRGQTVTGTVTNTYYNNGQFLVKINFDHGAFNLLPGVSADVAIKINSLENQILVPLSAYDNGEVTVLKGREKIKKKIKLGPNDGSMATLVEGDLQEDDELLLKSSIAK